ncbi:flagellar biosynthetic protein FliO [Alkalicaulis satelles]|uniref:flagellar biosynthetic protein FliO n=1 Tax=Alkalicaulis satelles TaxID=2609175 RepID=UPI0018ECE760|nr:flagellar biosynthetic protein FliO [Alkalicaulis satelles]
MDQVDFIRFFAALILVLGLLGGLALILRKGWVPPGFASFSQFQAPRSARRLGVRESLVIDPRRRVVIVRADGKDHVVLLGLNGETVLDAVPAPPEPVFEPVFEPEIAAQDSADDAGDKPGTGPGGRTP